MILMGLLFKLLNIYPLAVGLILGGVILFISNLYCTRKPEKEIFVQKIKKNK
jgi:uncharacterized membrane protein YqiK